MIKLKEALNDEKKVRFEKALKKASEENFTTIEEEIENLKWFVDSFESLKIYNQKRFEVEAGVDEYQGRVDWGKENGCKCKDDEERLEEYKDKLSKFIELPDNITYLTEEQQHWLIRHQYEEEFESETGESLAESISIEIICSLVDDRVLKTFMKLSIPQREEVLSYRQLKC